MKHRDLRHPLHHHPLDHFPEFLGSIAASGTDAAWSGFRPACFSPSRRTTSRPGRLLSDLAIEPGFERAFRKAR
jgi:hypothetical protein